MFTKLGNPINTSVAVWYNEKKVLEQKAIRLYAANFLTAAEVMTMKDILLRFSRLEELNQTSVSKTFHISLNFHPDDQFTNLKLILIAREYMELMLLTRQPYVVYQHLDTAHPHLHVLVSKISPTGKAIVFKRRPAHISRDALLFLSDKYQLMQGTKRKISMEPSIQEPQRLDYGRISLWEGVTRVLSYVLPVYKYADLNELNSILLLFNVQADNGRPGSHINKHRGLVYQVLDDNGKYMGGRIPAYKLPSSPGLPFLERTFAENTKNRLPGMEQLRTGIALALHGHPADWSELSRKLQKEKIKALPFMNTEGLIHELSFIDYRTKTVATGTNLGADFTATSIFQKLGIPQQFDIPGYTRRRMQDIDRSVPIRLTPADRKRALQYFELPVATPDFDRLIIKHKIKL
jgi:hypothetical protein